MEKKPFLELLVSIERFSQKGYGVGWAQKENSLHPHKVEVPFSQPGDQVLALVSRKRKGAYFGLLKQVVQESPFRVEPRCSHASLCGGCSWQQMSYEKQCLEKQAQVENLLKSLLVESSVVHPLLPCDRPWHYRNKMEYSFSQNKAGERFLGLIMSGSKGRVVSLTECHLTSPWFMKALGAVRSWWEGTDLLAYNRNANTGSLRNVTLREGKRTGHKLALLTVSGNPDYGLKKAHLHGFIDAIKKSVPEEGLATLSIFLQIHQSVKGQPTQLYEMHLFGPDHLVEELHVKQGLQIKNFRFKISPTAFFQPNCFQSEKLYSRALEMAGPGPHEHVLDLYAGTATLGLLFASIARKVTAIEINPHAVFDARVNKEWNQVDNLEIHQGDVFAVLKELSKDPSFVKPDLVVVDPPRAGLDSKALQLLAELSPKKIIYVSCNPKTQAENGIELQKAGYRLSETQAVDQFPHTVHIENLTLWQKD